MAALLAAPGVASANPVSLTVVGDACDLSGLDAEVTNLLAGSEATDARASVVTTRSDGALTADVSVVDAEGESYGTRTVTASSCRDLFDSVAVVIAMAVSDTVNRALPLTIPEPIGPIPPLSVPEHPATNETPMGITRAATTPARSELTLDGFVAGARSVTSSSEQVQIGARLKRGQRSMSLEIAAGALDEVAITTTNNITIATAELTLAPCAHVRSLTGCALLSGGVIRGSGESLYGARAMSIPMAATGLRLGWEHFVTSRVALRVHLDARAMLTKATFDVDYMPVWESSRFEGSAAVGLLARFL